jgi:hypothetical protein
MSDEQGYQGWKNYETWIVNLWMDDTSESHKSWRATAHIVWSRAHLDEPVLTRSEAVRFALADQIKDEFEDGHPLCDEASHYSTMLSAAISNVDWDELANDWLVADDDGPKGYEPLPEPAYR